LAFVRVSGAAAVTLGIALGLYWFGLREEAATKQVASEV
jgi:hypothetical protein